MQRLLIILLLLSTNFFYAQSQGKIKVQGKVIDSLGSPIYGATITLIKKNDTITQLSNEDGSFIFHFSYENSIELLITAEGFKNYQKKINLNNQWRIIALDSIILSLDYRNLAPVTVEGVKPIRIKEDTIDYNASSFKVREGSEVERLLKKLPGVDVDINGNVFFQGKQVSKVMVDGRIFFDGDMLTATRNLPAEIVDKIQLIDDYGDKARLTGIKSGKPQKVLNIVLKKDKRKGKFGQVQAGIGNEGKYTGNIYANDFNGNRQLSLNGGWDNNNSAGSEIVKKIGIGYGDQWGAKISGGGNINFSGNNHLFNNALEQDNFYGNSELTQTQSSESKGNSRGLDFNSTLIYYLDSSSMLRFAPVLNKQSSNETTINDNFTREQDSAFSKITSSNAITRSESNILLFGSGIYYEKKSLHSRNRFSFQAIFHYSDNQGKSDNVINTKVGSDSQYNFTKQHYLLYNINNAQDAVTALNYYVPLGKKGFLEFAYNLSFSKSSINKVTKTPDSSSNSLDVIDSLSDNYFYKLINNKFHAAYIGSLKKMNMTMSLDGQFSQQSGKLPDKGLAQSYRYFNLFPLIQISYNISTLQKLNFAYSTSSSPPSLQQIQPITDINNPQFPVIGNPYLKPSFSQNVNLSYEHASLSAKKFQGFVIGVNFNTSNSVIISNLIHPRDTSAVVQKTTYINVNGFYTGGMNYQLSLPSFINEILRISINGSIGGSHSVYMLDSILYPNINFSWAQNLDLRIIIPDIMEANFSGTYNYTITKNTSADNKFTTLSSATWLASGEHFLFRKWIFGYNLSQTFTMGSSRGLQSNPLLLNATIQRQFLKKNMAIFSFAGYNLLNNNSGVTQTVTPTSITKSQTKLVGRYFILSMIIKLQKFK